SELLLEQALQLTTLSELLRDVRAADELAADEDLRDRRPAGDLLQLLANRRVGEDVDGRDRRAGLAQRLERAVGVAAHHELRRALHEDGHGLLLDQALD